MNKNVLQNMLYKMCKNANVEGRDSLDRCRKLGHEFENMPQMYAWLQKVWEQKKAEKQVEQERRTNLPVREPQTLKLPQNIEPQKRGAPKPRQNLSKTSAKKKKRAAKKNKPLSLPERVWGEKYPSIQKMNPGEKTWKERATGGFDFSSLEIGDTVDIRASIYVTTSVNNQSSKLALFGGVGTAYEYAVPLVPEATFKTQAEHHIGAQVAIYIGNELTRDNPAELRLWSDDDATVRVDGWFVRVMALKRRE